MKYGEHFETESVPEWSLYNIDYNSLKHFIKVNTIRDQAKAITIPGSPDATLQRFEDEIYLELCRQHDRVGLFVFSKADEIRRRLVYLHNQTHRLILRCTHSNPRNMPLRRQRKFAKYEREIINCGEDIQALTRFVNAQVKAFRKILKKYRKWTGSNSLGAQFKDNVLSSSKSFTRCDFSQLKSDYEELLSSLRAVAPDQIPIPWPPEDEADAEDGGRSSRGNDQVSPRQVTIDHNPPEVHYWNEYDYGSEAGDNNQDDGYAIYVNPEHEGFPGMQAIVGFFKSPIVRAQSLWSKRTPGEHRPLLDTVAGPHQDVEAGNGSGNYGTIGSDGSYFTELPGAALDSPTITNGGQTTDTEADTTDYEYASSEEFPPGYEPHYAMLPSINDQRMARYRERVLFWGTLASFLSSFLLLAVAAVLIETGRHRLRVEVDAGVVVGAAASLGCACSGLVMALTRQDSVTLAFCLCVWLAFIVACVLNGTLLVLVMGNAA